MKAHASSDELRVGGEQYARQNVAFGFALHSVSFGVYVQKEKIGVGIIFAL